MKKIENYCNSLDILKKADYEMAENDEIYRMGVIGQFNLTFELAWKALKAVMEADGMAQAQTGSARDILKLAAGAGLISDSTVWLLMLRERNKSVHIYNEAEIDEFLILIRDSFTAAFEKLRTVLLKKQSEIEMDERL